MKSKLWLMTLIICLGLLMNSGCAAVLVGGGTVAYLKGDLKSKEEVSFDKLWEATQNTIKELGYAVKTKEQRPKSAKIVALSNLDQNISITLKSKSAILTEISIRVGMIGNEERSLQILDEIRKRY